MADSPTRFCERDDCNPCSSGGIQCLPLNIRYTNIVASERWSTQAHEQIMTTVTTLRNEMSTVLPLLDYPDISKKLDYLNTDKLPTRITHVAVLNHTLDKCLQGALCLLLRRPRQAELDSCIRLTSFPAVLPLLGDIATRLQKTKLLICPGPSNSKSNNYINTTFSAKSTLFRVETWSAKNNVSHSILPTTEGQSTNSEFQIRDAESSVRSTQISCRMAGNSRDPILLLSVRLVRIDDIWSIKEVIEPKRGSREQKLRSLFHPSRPCRSLSDSSVSAWKEPARSASKTTRLCSSSAGKRNTKDSISNLSGPCRRRILISGLSRINSRNQLCIPCR
jgi:hypothetical protein